MRLLAPIVAAAAIFNSAYNAMAAEDLTYEPSSVQDLNVPDDCTSFAAGGDHLLIEYEALLDGGRDGRKDKIAGPIEYYHLQLSENPSPSEMVINRLLKGMCENSTRVATWNDPLGLLLAPLYVESSLRPGWHPEEGTDQTSTFKLTTTLKHITKTEDYAIFHSIRIGNISNVIDLIDQQKGVNALDDMGQSVLMTAVQRGALPIVAALLNARKPRIKVDLAKANGFTALFYAMELRDTYIMQALLRRGANPNQQIKNDDGLGNTPLHFACLLEKKEHAEMLLNYGANPTLVNGYDQHPLQLLPREAVRSTKLKFKKMFEDAFRLLNTIESTDSPKYKPEFNSHLKRSMNGKVPDL